MGGTFDHLHDGHKFLLRTALRLSNNIEIGLTSQKLLKNKKAALCFQKILPFACSLILCCLCLNYGNKKIGDFKQSKKALVNVGIVQGNIAQEVKWDKVLQNLILNKYE